jgi:hypothetical protein
MIRALRTASGNVETSILIVTTLALLVTLTAVASDREDDVNRTTKLPRSSRRS